MLECVESVLEDPPTVLGSQSSGLRGVHEVDHSSDELLWRFDLREVADAFDDL
jgi:hypothetical protein